ncbi:DUF2806 domain-containing protein [Burkholderia contaminans]|uniref:DUF2806 domain-containing protein n=1 Tax=Burkholderia contaminans TaxID=488447 RepID=UPI000F58E7F0|nr:DUF2806 domain-containing protein [Burkholderia contaminans]RQT38655.1 DUF2806 domain-containing protein [Burkholderia contaminans]
MDFPGENLVIKLWDSLVDKGIGSLLKPWQARREAKADLTNRADEILLLAQAEHDAAAIRAGSKRAHQEGSRILLLEQNAEVVAGRVEPQLNMPQLIAAASQARGAQAVLDEVNVAKAVLHAESILKGDKTPATEKLLDSDWLRRWRDNAACVSSDELRSLWGNVLAEEVKAPGAYSLRTLDFLKNLSKDEAQQIQAMRPYVVNGSYLATYGQMRPSEGHYSLFPDSLQYLGLLGGPGRLGISKIVIASQRADQFYAELRTNGKVVTVQSTDAGKELWIHAYRLTPTGAEVFALCPILPDAEYLEALAKHIQELGFTVSVT